MLADLAPELLDQVLSRVDPVTTAFLGCTSSRFKSIVDNSRTWEHHCKNRWTHLNHGLPGGVAGSWRTAYSERNGWNSPKLLQRHTRASKDACSFAIADGPAGEELLLISTGPGIEVNCIEDDGSSVHCNQRNAPPQVMAGPVCQLGIATERFAVALHSGAGPSHPFASIVVTKLSAAADSGVLPLESQIDLVPDVATDIQHDASTGLSCSLVGRQLLTCDTDFRETARTHDFLSDYMLVSTRMLPGKAEVLAGSVHANDCALCDRYVGRPYQKALCFHKSRAHVAAICVFDLRAGTQMVQRDSIHHRSLHPVMQIVREHYLLTSHSGSPMCAWDRRMMSTYLWEEQPLDNCADLNNLQLEKPERPSSSQALYLSADGDVAVGKANNGMMWAWDLSATLGWQKGGFEPGSWLQASDNPDHMGTDFRDWPRALGAWSNYDWFSANSHDPVHVCNGRRNFLYSLGGIRANHRNVAVAAECKTWKCVSHLCLAS